MGPAAAGGTGWRQILAEHPRHRPPSPRRSAKPDDLEHPHRAVERDRHHIAGAHGAARRIDALAVDPDMAGGRECRRGLARAHHARVPQPLVDALAVQLPNV